MSKGCVGVFRVRIRRSLGGAHSMLLGCILGLASPDKNTEKSL
jgi:hypothetical protein